METKTVSNSKRRRDEYEDVNGFSIQAHTIFCKQIIMEGTKHPQLCKNHLNFIESGPPQRILIHKNGEWVDFLEDGMIDLVQEGFATKNKTVLCEVGFMRSPCLVDFLHMALFHLRTGWRQPIGWISKAGKCFFPVNSNFSSIQCWGKEIKREDEILAAPTSSKEDFMGGSKPLRLLPQTLHRILTNDEKQHFLANRDNIVGMKGFTDARAQARLKRFEEEVKIVERVRGYANVRYAWLGTTKEAVCRILRTGMVCNGLPKATPNYGNGVHFASAICADISSSYCDIDEKGLQYMVLCRVILGNVEPIEAGSKQFFPSSNNFDSGVDHVVNPKRYIIWNKNMNSHIYPEYAASFKKPQSNVQTNDCLVETTSVATAAKEVPSEKKLEPNGSRGPLKVYQRKNLSKKFGGPYFPVSMLLTEMEDKVPFSVMKIVYQFHEQQQKKKMSKDQLFQNMRLIVGDSLMRDTLLSLRPKLDSCKPEVVSKQ